LGKWDIHRYPAESIKRVRMIRRADGYYVQFCVDADCKQDAPTTGRELGIDVGLEYFYSDSNGHHEPNPRFLKKSEKRVKHYQRKIYKKKKHSANRRKARNRYARKHLKISRQRTEHAKKLARHVMQSNDLAVYENLKVRNLVKNHCLAKSINDAGWYQFRVWLEHFAMKFGKVAVAVEPHYTSQECPKCHAKVKKSLSQRTHVCACGCELQRDHAASIIILNRGKEQLAPIATGGHPESKPTTPKRGRKAKNACGDAASTGADESLH
jgi:putative transposase